MDDARFDRLTRAVGTRRGLVGGLAVLLAGVASPPAAARRRRRKCGSRRPCPDGFACRDGRCVCDSGITCRTACCAAGETCTDGRCGSGPAPECLPLGDLCKGIGIPCCDGVTCASGQGGQQDIRCYVPAGGACDDTSDCVYDSSCVDGACVATPDPGPAPTCDILAGPDAAANFAALKTAIESAAAGATVAVGPGDYRFTAEATISVTRDISVVACRAIPPRLLAVGVGNGARGVGLPPLFTVQSPAALTVSGLRLENSPLISKIAFQLYDSARISLTDTLVDRFIVGIDATGLASRVSLGGGVRITNSLSQGCSWNTEKSEQFTPPTPRVSCSGAGNVVSGSVFGDCVWRSTKICPTGCGCGCPNGTNCINQICGT